MKVRTFLLTILVVSFLPVSVFATVASSSQIYEGIDVSNWQGYINYEAVKNAGIDVVYIKSSQGSNIVDPYFRINYNNAKENRIESRLLSFLNS